MVRMKRIKEKEWTRVLQKRLQDAQLPLDGKLLSAPDGGVVQPAARPAVWWPYALAGVAAAVIAALLLLRPSSSREPDLLVQQPVNSSAQPANLSSPTVSSVIPDAIGNLSSGSLPEPDPEPSAPADYLASARPALELPPEPSSNQAPDEDEGLKTEEPSSNQASSEDGRAENELPSSKQGVGEDAGIKIAAQSSNPVEIEDGWDFPEEPKRTRRAQRGKISLRVHAATAGAFRSGGTGQMNVPSIATDEGQWFLADDAKYLVDNAIFEGADVTNSNDPSKLKWVFVRDEAQNAIPVRQAPVIPVSVGISFAFPLSRSWSLTAGVDYMQHDGYRLYDGRPQSLTLHYLGVPVDVQYYFNPESRWRVYLGAGVHAAKCIAATGGEQLQDPVLFSGNVMAGTDFRLFPGVRFYLAPVLSVPFNHSAYINSWDDKLQFQIRAGLSFDLK